MDSIPYFFKQNCNYLFEFNQLIFQEVLKALKVEIKSNFYRFLYSKIIQFLILEL